jgi:hypothetical protein
MAAASTDTPPVDLKRVQAMLGNGKQQSMAVFHAQKGVKETLGEDRVKSSDTIVFKDCHDSEFLIEAMCTKLTLDNCHNCVFNVQGKVITQVAELFRCSKASFTFNTKVATLQVDQCTEVMAQYAKREFFHHIVWAGTEALDLQFHDAPEHKILTGFDDMQKKQKEPLRMDIDQFIVQFVDDELMSEKVVRFENGFPTTQREKNAYEARRDANMEKFAKAAGITIFRTEKKEARPQGRNEDCNCGSGKKFKKCCGAAKK